MARLPTEVVAGALVAGTGLEDERIAAAELYHRADFGERDDAVTMQYRVPGRCSDSKRPALVR